jgi:cellulose synthase/poly-beta-1,6-N-acetylglucosamine synthase-like glycosyltransferase
VLHHQGETGAGGDGESLGAAPNRALNGDGGGEFVFHLDEDAADGGDSPGEAFDYFRRGRDGIACGKSRTGCEGSLTTCVVTVEEMYTGEDTFGVSVHCELRR